MAPFRSQRVYFCQPKKGQRIVCEIWMRLLPICSKVRTRRLVRLWDLSALAKTGALLASDVVGRRICVDFFSSTNVHFRQQSRHSEPREQIPKADVGRSTNLAAGIRRTHAGTVMCFPPNTACQFSISLTTTSSIAWAISETAE